MIFLASPGVTTFDPRFWRFDLVSLLVRMWRLKALARTTFPVPVFLKRFAAPLCVLSFGISITVVVIPLSLVPARRPVSSSAPTFLPHAGSG